MSGSRSVNTRSKSFQSAVAEAVKEAVPQIIHEFQQLQQKETNNDSAATGSGTGRGIVQEATDNHANDLTGETHTLVDEDISIRGQIHRPQPVVPEPHARPPPEPVKRPFDNPYDWGVRLDASVTPKQRETILAHKYIDLKTLFKRDDRPTETKQYVKVQDNKFVLEDEVVVKGGDDIDAWTVQFSIYATVMVIEQPQEAYGLFHYLDYVRYLNTQGYDWQSYDTQYRKLHEDNPKLFPFYREYYSLAFKCEKRARTETETVPRPKPSYDYSQQQQYNNQQPRYRPRNRQPFRASSYRTAVPDDAPEDPYGYCWVFNRGQQCQGCEFPRGHTCWWCDGRHAGVRCSARPGQSTATHTTTTQSGTTSQQPGRGRGLGRRTVIPPGAASQSNNEGHSTHAS